MLFGYLLLSFAAFFDSIGAVIDSGVELYLSFKSIVVFKSVFGLLGDSGN